MNNLKLLIQKENLTVLGSIIKINRINQNMSQQALSEGICVPSYLSKIENGEVVPSLEMIRLIFQELHIEYTDEYHFVKGNKDKLVSFFEELNLNGFIKSREIYKSLESNENKLIHSPLIIDYYIAKLAFYCGTNHQDKFKKAKKTIQSVEGLLNKVQKHRYFFYEAINLLVKEKDFIRAKEKLVLAKESMESGHLYYFLANVDFKLGSYYGAVIYAEKALSFYLEEVNIICVSLIHQFQGILIYHLGSMDLYESYFEKAILYAQKIKRNDILLTTLTLYLYIQIKEKKENATTLFNHIKTLLNTDQTLSEYTSLMQILAYLFQNKFDESIQFDRGAVVDKYYQYLYEIFEMINANEVINKEKVEELQKRYEQDGHQNLLNDLIVEDIWNYFIESNRFYKQGYLKLKNNRL
ncbi:helix-turn-helix domain-containing protein [Bacillus sp. EAC]|uniref:helix-turn-helix domain-containing protein n=1 Tax=Bacillus sp. EAC TaxID=1978338 RepID=UPI000B4324B0|nr:helix-turn-helix transcriptional regulator [Bacillus sp. EAC]